jgi:hypothetical protein
MKYSHATWMQKGKKGKIRSEISDQLADMLDTHPDTPLERMRNRTLQEVIPAICQYHHDYERATLYGHSPKHPDKIIGRGMVIMARALGEAYGQVVLNMVVRLNAPMLPEGALEQMHKAFNSGMRSVTSEYTRREDGATK